MPLDVYKDWLGIPEGPRPPDHYALLRLVRFEDDADKIRGNYKKLNAHVRKYATGQYAAESQELLNELAKAMLCLTDASRKRDYDESLGREFEEEPGARMSMDRVLVKQKKITREQAREAQEFAEARGLTLRDAVVQMKLAEPEQAAMAYAVELGLPFVDLADMLPDDEVLDQVPRNTVRRNSILPLFVDDAMLLVACIDMPSHELEEELRLRCGVPMRPVLSTPRAIQQAIAKHYAPGTRDESAAAASDGGRKSSAEMAKAKAKPAASPGRRFSQLSDYEKQQRRQLGIIIMCWGIVAPVLLDYYILGAMFRWWLFLPLLPFSLLTLVITPAVILWVLGSYWK